MPEKARIKIFSQGCGDGSEGTSSHCTLERVKGTCWDGGELTDMGETEGGCSRSIWFWEGYRGVICCELCVSDACIEDWGKMRIPLPGGSLAELGLWNFLKFIKLR